MNVATVGPLSPSPSFVHGRFRPRYFLHPPPFRRSRHLNPSPVRRSPAFLSISSSLFRRGFRKAPAKSERRLEMVIDLDDISHRASTSLDRLFKSCRGKFDGIVSSGSEALSDLHSLVAVDRQGRVVIACRRSSLQFLAGFAIWSFVVVALVRVLVGLWVRSGLGFGLGGWDFVRRRDRSLGGREVVVGRRLSKRDNYRPSVNPLSSVRDRTTTKVAENAVSSNRLTRKEKKLPDWWPNSVRLVPVRMGNPELQREAKRLIRAIMDNRMSGKDLTEDEIIQLRQICKTSRARVSFETENTRDSFYRASVDFVLKTCSKTSSKVDSLEIDGEDVREFIAGLADNIGLEDTRAATILCAAVAARTRSGFLEAWAFEIQGRRLDALDELLKICYIHQTFPPQVHSPEMEMVAHGLKNYLKTEQREHLYSLFVGVCHADSQIAIREALGLIP